MEGRLLSVAITGEASGRLSDCATCGVNTGENLTTSNRLSVKLSQAWQVDNYVSVFSFNSSFISRMFSELP